MYLLNISATQSFYADMLLYDLQHNHQPQAIPDKRDLKRGKYSTWNSSGLHIFNNTVKKYLNEN